MKYETDHCNLMTDAEERGEQRGIRIGEERGIRIGRKYERRRSEAAPADKDATVADKDAETARLRARLS